jgi:hypothetical protein
MQIEVTGRLIGDNGLADPAIQLGEVKDLTLYILSHDDDYKKINNICSNYSKRKMPTQRISNKEGMKGIKLLIRVRCLYGKMGDEMLKLPREEWKNKMFVVKFKIVNYQISSKARHNYGEVIKGCNFMLEHIELYN